MNPTVETDSQESELTKNDDRYLVPVWYVVWQFYKPLTSKPKK